MPKNRHMSFGDMQAQKSRDQKLAKLQAMLKPSEKATSNAAELSQEKSAPAKKATSKSVAKKTPAKKKTGKK